MRGGFPASRALTFASMLIALFAVTPARAATPTTPPPASRAYSYCLGCPAMIDVPAGNFAMGSTVAEADRENMPADQAAREHPQRKVTIAKPFALSQTEVTVAQYAAFSEATQRPAGECQAYFKVENVFTGWLPIHGSSWSQPIFLQAPDHPVACVSWEDAAAYVQWLSIRTGKHFRLPSEAEWEYAARAGTATARYWGDGVEDVCRYANVADVNAFRKKFTCNDGYSYTAPATYGIPNQFGLYGMLGNVGEWTADCGLPDLAVQTPGDGSAYTKGDCSSHVGRGGSWWNDAYYIRAARRFTSTGRYYIMGFRVAMDGD